MHSPTTPTPNDLPRHFLSRLGTNGNRPYNSSTRSNVSSINSINGSLTETNSNDFPLIRPEQPHKLIMQTTPRRSSLSPENDTIAKLVYSTSYGGKMDFQLVRNETKIGRREDNHIILHDGKISKYHAAILKTQTG